MHYIGVLDCNNFFVSCERLFRPDLRRKPVLVLSNNDGCVVARSNEVKDMGVAMGVPYFQIKDIIKDNGIICFSSHFALYRDISKRVFTVVAEAFPGLEIYSIDEAFFAFEAADEAMALARAQTLKEVVEKRVGIPVSIGLSDTKTRAKLVSKIAKKQGGLACLTGNSFLEVCGERLLADVWGVGGRLSRRYRDDGVVTIADLVSVPAARLSVIGHVPGLRLQAELRGEVAYPVAVSQALPKSMMSTRSFSKKTNDLSLIKDAVAYHVRQVVGDLTEQGLAATTLSLMLQTSRHGEYALRGGICVHTFTVPTVSISECLSRALELVDSLYEQAVPYAKAGIVLSGLIPKNHIPQSLFAESPTPGAAIDTVFASLQQRFGDAVTLGKFSQERTWEAKRDNISPDYTTSWSALRTVKTDV